MNLPFVDTVALSADTFDIEKLSDDHTVGMLYGGEELRGQIRVDTKRLQMALLAYQDEFQDDHPELAIVDSDDDRPPLLALTNSGSDDRALVLTPRLTLEGDLLTDGDALLENGGDSA